MTEKNREKLLACLPSEVRRELLKLGAGQADFYERLFEVRLRARRRVALTYGGRNLLLPITVGEEALSQTLATLCEGSVYAYAESLRQGYLTVFGFRVGVGGRAVLEGDRISALASPTSLCIRVPHEIRGAGEAAWRLFRSLGGRRGFLVYSPPGGGKTTLLRDLARLLSTGEEGRRVALIDTRGELFDESLPSSCQIDTLSGYPLAEGIEIATRTLAPEVILCDELGSPADAAAVLASAGTGVPIIASAHGGTVADLMAREPLRALIDRGVFAAFLGILREGDGIYRYKTDRITETAEGERRICSLA